jgi:hypothetical protein
MPTAFATNIPRALLTTGESGLMGFVNHAETLLAVEQMLGEEVGATLMIDTSTRPVSR